MKVVFVLFCVIIGGVAGYQVGIWWLNRTVESPELETAVYPGIGTIAGVMLGLVVGVSLASLTREKHRD